MEQTLKTDPAVAAYDDWRKAHAAYIAALAAREADDDPVVEAANQADHAAARKLANTVPTTLAGLAALVKFMPYCFGEISRPGDVEDPESYVFGNWVGDYRERDFCQTMRAAVDRLRSTA